MRIPQKPPVVNVLTEDLFSSPQRLQKVLAADIRATFNGRYSHWEKVRTLCTPTLEPMLTGLTKHG